MTSPSPLSDAHPAAAASPSDDQVQPRPWGIVTGDFVPTGGMDCANLHLARWLAQSRSVELVTHRLDATLGDLPRVVHHNVPRPFGRHWFGEGKLRRAGARVAAGLLVGGGRFVANGGNCDAGDVNWVHYVHAAYRPTHATSLLRRAKGVWHHRTCLKHEQQALTRARIVVCNSRMTARHAVELVGTDADRVATVYYGCDSDRFPRVTPAARAEARRELGWEDRPWLVFIGALGDRRKGFDTLYEAWRTLTADPGWDAALAVVGSGAEVPLWRKRAQQDGVDRSIRFLGFRDDVPRVLSAAEGLVHPARYEAYGLGVQEAIVTGLPTIVTANCGVAERLGDGLHDLILPQPSDPHRLAETLRHWHRDLEAWSDRVRSTSERLRAYTWDHMARDFVAAVEGGAG